MTNEELKKAIEDLEFAEYNDIEKRMDKLEKIYELFEKAQSDFNKKIDKLKKRIDNPSGEVNCSVRCIHEIIDETLLKGEKE